MKPSNSVPNKRSKRSQSVRAEIPSSVAPKRRCYRRGRTHRRAVIAEAKALSTALALTRDDAEDAVIESCSCGGSGDSIDAADTELELGLEADGEADIAEAEAMRFWQALSRWRHRR